MDCGNSLRRRGICGIGASLLRDRYQAEWLEGNDGVFSACAERGRVRVRTRWGPKSASTTVSVSMGVRDKIGSQKREFESDE